jgi:hypothetical protein
MGGSSGCPGLFGCLRVCVLRVACCVFGTDGNRLATALPRPHLPAVQHLSSATVLRCNVPYTSCCVHQQFLELSSLSLLHILYNFLSFHFYAILSGPHSERMHDLARLCCQARKIPRTKGGVRPQDVALLGGAYAYGPTTNDNHDELKEDNRSRSFFQRRSMFESAQCGVWRISRNPGLRAPGHGGPTSCCVARERIRTDMNRPTTRRRQHNGDPRRPRQQPNNHRTK